MLIARAEMLGSDNIGSRGELASPATKDLCFTNESSFAPAQDDKPNRDFRCAV